VVYLGGAAYLLLTSRLTWVWEHPPDPPPVILGSNLYVWFGLAMLIWAPIGARQALPVAEPDRVRT
jgi:alpha-1,2-mannosyltransferase